jgi:hypothetical protein
MSNSEQNQNPDNIQTDKKTAGSNSSEELIMERFTADEFISLIYKILIATGVLAFLLSLLEGPPPKDLFVEKESGEFFGALLTWNGICWFGAAGFAVFTWKRNYHYFNKLTASHVRIISLLCCAYLGVVLLVKFIIGNILPALPWPLFNVFTLLYLYLAVSLFIMWRNQEEATDENINKQLRKNPLQMYK